MAHFQLLENLINVVGSCNLHDCMRLWFVQQAVKDDALSKLLIACCQHLKRVMVKNQSMIANMEALGPHTVCLESLLALKKTQERHQVLLEKLGGLFFQVKAGVREEETNVIKINEFS